MDSNSARRRVAIRIAEFVLPILEPGYTDPYNICNELELEYKEENTIVWKHYKLCLQRRSMTIVCIIELCSYGKQIAPALMMTFTAITTLSILLCKIKKNKMNTQKHSANNESIVRVSMHGQDSSISTEPNFSSSIGNKNSNLKIESTQIPSDQNQEKSGSNKGIKDDVTPLNSEPTEEDTEIGAIKEKQEIGIEKESSKENKKNFNIKTTRKSLMRNQLNMRMLENGVVTAGTKMNFVNFPVDQSQVSNLTQDSTEDSWLKCENDKTELKTMREIPLEKLLSLKKGMKELETNQSQVSADSIPSYSSKSATGDEEMEKSNDEFSDSEETKSEK
ncbi:Gamma-aminobutyric acid receptor [Dirofilaria immitis]